MPRRIIAIIAILILGSLLYLIGLCKPLSWWIFWIGFIGLSMDLAGAFIIVLTDLPLFDRIWTNEEKRERANKLKSAKATLFDPNNSLEDTSVGFEVLLDVIDDNTDIPNQINEITIRGNRLGGAGGEVGVRDNNGNWENVAYPEGVKDWIDTRIDRLEGNIRIRYRGYGLALLLFGFAFQILSYVLRNSGYMRDFLIQYLSC